MKTALASDTAKNVIASKPDALNQKPQSDSTSASFGDETQKLFLDSNINNKLNIKKINKNNMELQNINEDIFPKERQGGSYNYFNTELNMNGNIQINSNANSAENTLEKNKEIIFNNDIPEMLLFKYNYDMTQYKESLNDIDYEVEWMYDFLNMGKCDKRLNDPNEVKGCLKNLLICYKKNKYDIPYIIANYENNFKNCFRQDEVFDILSVYDVEFLRLQKKRKKILKFYDYIINKKDDWSLGKDIEQYYLKKKYILEAKTSLELDLIEALLGILTYVNQSNEVDENCKSMINVEILENLNIDYSLLNKVKDDKLDEIIKQFCLYPEQVVHNLKVINGEINENVIPPPFPGCPLNDLCKKPMVETAGKYATTKDILMTSFQYYNLILSLNPYIFNLIYKKLYDIYYLSTEPTEKGKEILNSLHPSFHCKRINKMPIKYFFEEKNESLCNIYTKNFGEIFLDIEKCENTGLIKYLLNNEETPDEIQNLKNLLSKACNGLNNKMEIEENISNSNQNENVLKKKYVGARNLCLDNLLIISKGFFVNILKTKLHNYSEKSLIKKISKEFYNIISRNFIGKTNLDKAYTFSIIYNSEKKYFKLICLSPNFSIKQTKELHYVWKNDNIMEGDLELALNSSEEQAQFHKLLVDYCPKAIVIDVSHLESYKMINFIRGKFRDYNLIYSDYNSIIYKLKSNQMNSNQEEKVAIDQVRYIINPVNQIIDLWRYKYEDNLLLNLSLHPLQENIKDTPLLCYSLENQLIRVVNSKGIDLTNLLNYSFNLFNFISGLGPSTSSIIIKNIRNYNEIKNSLRKKCPNIYNNMEIFMIENTIYKCNIYNLKRDNDECGLNKIDMFRAMIKDKIYFKKNCLCNAIVNNVDTLNQIINCYLLRGENTIKALLRFNSVDSYIKDIKKYFYPQRIILCKIKDIILRHNSYEIYISNKNEDLISVKDFFSTEYENSELISKKYINIENEDFVIKEIERLRDTQKLNEERTDDKKKLKYNLISLENENILRNVNYINMKKIIRMDYIVRPSFRGDNFLTLSFFLIDDIYLNYDIEIITHIESNDESNNTITEYKLGYNTYNSLTDLVNKFASKMKNSIENFRKNDYFKKPEEIRELFSKILGIENPRQLNNKEKNKNSIEIKPKKKVIENENIKTNVVNVIIFGFMKEEPEYGIILTKTSDELNYTIDFIKFMCNGYLFHGVLYTNLNEIIFYLKEKRKTPLFQNLLKSQFICTTHAQIEEIDEQYTDFEGVDPNLEKYKKSYISPYDLNNLKNNLLPNENDINNDNNAMLGKKRYGEDLWGNDILNKDKDNSNNNINLNSNENVWGMEENNNNEDNNWNIKTENKKDNNGWEVNQENAGDFWTSNDNNNNKNNNNESNWGNEINNNNNNWDEGNASNNNNNEGNNNWGNNSNNNNYNRQNSNNRFNNKKSFSKGSNNNKKFDKNRNNNFNKNKKFNNNNNNNRNKGNDNWKNNDRKKPESNFSWGNNNTNNDQSNDNWNTDNNNENKNATDSWPNDTNKNYGNENNDYWGVNDIDNTGNNWNTIVINDDKKEDKNEIKDNTNNNNSNNNNNQWPCENSNSNPNDEWFGVSNKNEWNENTNNNDFTKSTNNQNRNKDNNNWNKNDNNNWNKKNDFKTNNLNNSNNNNNNEWPSTNNEWGTCDNEWGADNKNWNENNNSWGNENNNNNTSNDLWNESKENKNKNNNMNTSWNWNDNNNNNKNNDGSWGDNSKKTSFNKGNKNNNNFHNRNNSYNNNNNRRNFSHNRNNNHNNHNNNNKGSFNQNRGSNNNQNKFGNNKGKKNEKRWANELDKNIGETDIKQEDNEKVVDFENYEGFGGFDTNKEKAEE